MKFGLLFLALSAPAFAQVVPTPTVTVTSTQAVPLADFVAAFAPPTATLTPTLTPTSTVTSNGLASPTPSVTETPLPSAMRKKYGRYFFRKYRRP